jgi:hypothetical protein
MSKANRSFLRTLDEEAWSRIGEHGDRYFLALVPTDVSWRASSMVPTEQFRSSRQGFWKAEALATQSQLLGLPRAGGVTGGATSPAKPTSNVVAT